MPTAVVDKLAHKFTGHDVNLQRLQATHRNKIFKSLRKLEIELVAKIADSTKETLTVQRNRALLKETRRTIETKYAGIEEEHRTMLKDLGKYELEATAKIVNKQYGVNLMAVGVSEAVIDSMLEANTVFGAPLTSFWEQQSLSLQNKFATEMRAGIYAGETNDQLIQRVRGTKAGGFKDGIMESSRHGAEVVVRTSAQSILNDARMEVFKANEDVIDGVQAQVTLDLATTDICMARSGFAWDLEGNPFPDTDTDEDFPGPPPWHPNCRSSLIPIVKSLGTLLDDPKLDKHLEKELENIPEATQSSMHGQVAGNLTYEDWLSAQSKEDQLEALGPGKYELWKSDKISLRDLIDQRGRPLSLKELRKREA